MKSRFVFVLWMFLVQSILLQGQGSSMLPIDSLYLGGMEAFYRKAAAFSEEVWPGMRLSPMCAFRENGPAFLYNHPNPPETFKRIGDQLYAGEQAELKIAGATQAEINGVLTAVVGYDSPRYAGAEEVFAELFHEIHHVYQLKHVRSLKPDNPVTLLLYPEDYRNDAMKMAEQKLLFSLCFCDDSKEFATMLNQYKRIRDNREEFIGKEFLEYEKDVESLEGPAFYCQLMYYKAVGGGDSAVKNNFIQKEFFGVLTTPYYGRESLRYRHLASGMAMCVLLDRQNSQWKSEYYASGMKLYDYFVTQFSFNDAGFQEIAVDCAISKFHTQKIRDRHFENLHRFNRQSGIKVTLNFRKPPEFRGFDPMHAEAINDSVVLHTTLLSLKGSDRNELFITGWPALTQSTDEIWHVKSVTLFLPEKETEIRRDRIIVKGEHVSIVWEGTVERKGSGEVWVECE